MSTVFFIPFSKLVASDEINARAATKEGLDELAASIASKGLIQPLCVRQAAGDKYEIIDGRRRHAALAKLVKAKSISKLYDVPVLVRDDDDGSALETSLMANTVRLPMHPVDQHAVFARLTDSGVSEAEIAERFGITARTVKQHLALGRLAPPVRDAWRKGKIDRETAQAFTLHADHAVQIAAFDELKKQGSYTLQPHYVRAKLSVQRESVQTCQEIKLIGEDAYLAAGGTISESLFEEARYVDDVTLAQKLARDVLHEECEQLRAAGWSWAELDEDDGGPYANYDCPYLRDDGEQDDNTSEFTAEEMARSGCVVGLLNDGTIKIVRGLLKPDAAAPENDADHEDDSDENPLDDDASDLHEDESEDDEPSPIDDTSHQISGALLESITTAQTEAVAVLVKENFELALRLALAALQSNDYSSPAKITTTQQAHLRPEKRDFASVWPRVVNLSYGEAMQQFATVMAGAMSCVEANSYSSNEAGRSALVETLPGDKYLLWMREAFNAADYFKRSSKETCLAAVNEMVAAGCLSAPPTISKFKKTEMAEFAARAAKEHGWLPVHVRHPSYAIAPRIGETTPNGEQRLVKALTVVSEGAEAAE
jgi:ParB family chromosome partitioning protein